MRLNEVLLREGDSQLLAQLGDSGALMLSSSIGEQDERDVVIVEVFESSSGTRNRCRGSKKDAVDTAGTKRSATEQLVQ